MAKQWNRAFVVSGVVSVVALATHFLSVGAWLTVALLAVVTLFASVLVFASAENPKQAEESALEQNRDLSQATKEIDNKASDLAINSAEISFFLNQLSESIDSSSADVQRLAAAAHQISTNAEQITSNADTSYQQATQAQQACQNSSDNLNSSIAVINSLNESVVQAAGQLESLEQMANEIQSITNVINSISEQTNLLALNAAIEAARAGEHGRGFAVVADEVRALASKTAGATEQIGEMLNLINRDTKSTTLVMNGLLSQSETVVSSMSSLHASFDTINQLMQESANAGELISTALGEQNSSTHELSESISNLHQFLSDKAGQTAKISSKANDLSASTESIFVLLSHFDTGSITDVMAQQAQLAAQKVAATFERCITEAKISEQALFNFDYRPIAGVTPAKYKTDFDDFTDGVLPAIQEPLLAQFDAMIYAGAVDINGYFPTHNQCFSKPLTGDVERDMVGNRTKRIFDDPTGIRCGKHQQKFLLQTYKRDTGEIMHDVSAPIWVNGKHWGGFRIGFRAQ